MPIEWSIIFLGTIAGCVYFSWMAGFKRGIEEATVLTIAQLESTGIIKIVDGEIKPVQR